MTGEKVGEHQLCDPDGLTRNDSRVSEPYECPGWRGASRTTYIECSNPIHKDPNTR